MYNHWITKFVLVVTVVPVSEQPTAVIVEVPEKKEEPEK